MKTKFFGLILAVLLFGPDLARADLHLVFDIIEDEDVPAQNDGKTPPSHTSRKLHAKVFLGSNYIDEESEEGRTLIDFSGLKFYGLFSKDKTYAAYSLYSIVGFRVQELQNRLSLAKVLSAAAVKDVTMGGRYAENELSIRAPDSPSLPPPVASDTTLTYALEGKPLFSRTSDGQKLNATEAAQFVRFIRYQCGLHPDILDAWQKAATLPSHFDIYHYGPAIIHQQFSLLSFDRVEHKFSPLEQLAGLKEVDVPALALCAKANTLDHAQYSARCDDLKNLAVAEAKAGHNLDAVLLFLSYTLATGQQMPPEFSTYRDALTQDRDAALLIKSITPKNEEEGRAAITVLSSLEMKAKSGKVFLNIYEANILDHLGQADDAVKLLIAVLNEHPYMVGVWHDLGDLYYKRFAPGEAWACWDAGRRLLPTHPLFKDVDDFEKSLKTQHPEYF